MYYKKSVIKDYNPNSEIPLSTLKEYNENREFGYKKYICNAPFVSMYFGLLGEIAVCCLNRTYLLGNIKKKSIAECWNGERLLRLRESIENQSLNLGCVQCKHQIIAGNYKNLVASEYDGYFHKL